MGSGQPLRLVMLSTFPPSMSGTARFSDRLSRALTDRGVEVGIVRLGEGADSSDPRVIGEVADGSSASQTRCVELLNSGDVALIQHQDDLYTGVHGEALLGILGALRVPSVVVVHTVLKDPEPHRRWVLERIAATADQLVVLSEAARERLCRDYAVERDKVLTIPHGGRIPTSPRLKRPSRPLLLTWGSLGPGKGIERVIDSMASLRGVPGQPRYLVVGQTHRKVAAVQGEAYREARMEQAVACGVADSVTLDARPYDRSALAALVQSACAVVLPYDSRDQVSSAILVEAIASGRPVVATAFPHAVELLSHGAGILVDHDDPAAMDSALRRVLTQPRLAGAMAAEARRLAPSLAWSTVADSYIRLAERTIVAYRARQ
ncbi:glycosyltransferase [Mycolicibacterium vaccae]|uniref:glycosyltransferase n=1 Tax=Mycolicibacterium vaccae TaxID=1810 RepID=UPI003CFEA0C9